MEETTFSLVETGDLDLFWACDGCDVEFADSRNFKKTTTHCPHCGRFITEWYELYEEE